MVNTEEHLNGSRIANLKVVNTQPVEQSTSKCYTYESLCFTKILENGLVWGSKCRSQCSIVPEMLKVSHYK